MAKSTLTGPALGLPSALFHQDLSNVNEQLRRVVESLKAHREQREGTASPVPEEPRVHERLMEIEREHRRLLERFTAVEEQTFRLTTLFVALHQLHQSTERTDVLTALQEIVVNLLGSEQLAIFELAPGGKVLSLVQSLGISRDAWREVAVGDGHIGRVISEGVARLRPTRFRDMMVTACVPLRAGRRIVGALAIFELLPHKLLLSPFDLELLETLSIHAGAALSLALHERRGQR